MGKNEQQLQIICEGEREEGEREEGERGGRERGWDMSVFQAFLCTLFCCTSLFKCSCRNIYADIYIYIACVCVRVCMRDVCRTAPKSQISHESSRKFASFIWPRISVCSLVCHIFAYPVTMQCRQEGVLLITQTKSPKSRTFGRHPSRFLYFQIVLIKYYVSLWSALINSVSSRRTHELTDTRTHGQVRFLC